VHGEIREGDEMSEYKNCPVCGECPNTFECDVFKTYWRSSPVNFSYDEIRPGCPLREIEVVKQAVIDSQVEVGKKYPAGTIYE
jgi:hypothetical protein